MGELHSVWPKVVNHDFDVFELICTLLSFPRIHSAVSGHYVCTHSPIEPTPFPVLILLFAVYKPRRIDTSKIVMEHS